MDVEWSFEGSEGTEERALELNADWQRKVVPLIETKQNVELGVARHVDGRSTMISQRQPAIRMGPPV